MPDPLPSYSDAQQRTEEQKKALLQAIAESGTAGSQLMQQQQGATNEARNLALAAQANPGGGYAQGSPEFAAQVAGIVANPYNQQAQNLQTAQSVFEQDVARQAAGNQAYLTQVQAAYPIEESRARTAVEAMVRQQQQEEAQRAMQIQMQQLELQAQREQIAAARESRGAAGRDPLEQRAMELDIARAEKELGAFEAQQASDKENAAFGDVIAQYAGGNPNDPRAVAIGRILNGENFGSATGRLKSGVIGLSRDDMLSDIRQGVVSYRKTLGIQPKPKPKKKRRNRPGFGQ